MIPTYCTQNDGNCQSCELSNDDRDCMNQRFLYPISELTKALKAPERIVRKMLNDAGAIPRLDELNDNPSEQISRSLVVDLAEIRADDKVGQVLRIYMRQY